MDGKKMSAASFLLFFFLLLLASLVACSSGESTETLCFSNRCFQLERADTFAEREIGMMNRTALAENEGMVFVFEKEGIYPFWMKDTLISLDMIWLDDDLRVVRILSAEPCAADPCQIYDPDVAARYVIELQNGTAETMRLEVGDYFQWEN